MQKPLMDMLAEAYRDERNADCFYTEILSLSQDFDIVDTFAEARRDERDHARTIARLILRMNGKKPEFTPSLPPYESLDDAVRKALEGELKAITFYQEIINATSNKEIQSDFEEIRDDEIVHAKKMAALLREMYANDNNNSTMNYLIPY